MKKKLYKLFAIAIAVMLVLTLCTALLGCDKTPDETPKPTPDQPDKSQPTDPEPNPPQPKPSDPKADFAEWLVGHKNTLAYNGVYTVRSTDKYIVTGDEAMSNMDEVTETRDGNKYLRLRRTYEMDADGNVATTPIGTDTLCIKVVDDNGTMRNKRLEASNSADGENSREGAWVRPTEADEIITYRVPSKLTFIVDLKEDTLSAFEHALAEYYKQVGESTDYQVTAETVRNEDNSVSLVARISTTYADGYIAKDDADYVDSAVSITATVTMADGKLVRTENVMTMEHRFKVAKKNVSMWESTIYNVEYAFAEEEYAAVDMTTEVTQNNYTARLNWVIEGYDYGYCSFPLVGERYSADNAIEDFTSAYIIERDFEIEGVAYESLFSLYADETMTVPFTGFDAIEEHSTIYVKINAPEGTAVVLSLYRYNDSLRVLRVCICDGGDNYTVGDQGGSYSHLKNYNVVSFNGEEWDTPAPAKFTVESGKVYVIVVQYVDND